MTEYDRQLNQYEQVEADKLKVAINRSGFKEYTNAYYDDKILRLLLVDTRLTKAYCFGKKAWNEKTNKMSKEMIEPDLKTAVEVADRARQDGSPVTYVGTNIIIGFYCSKEIQQFLWAVYEALIDSTLKAIMAGKDTLLAPKKQEDVRKAADPRGTLMVLMPQEMYDTDSKGHHYGKATVATSVVYADEEDETKNSVDPNNFQAHRPLKWAPKRFALYYTDTTPEEGQIHLENVRMIANPYEVAQDKMHMGQLSFELHLNKDRKVGLHLVGGLLWRTEKDEFKGEKRVIDTFESLKNAQSALPPEKRMRFSTSD